MNRFIGRCFTLLLLCACAQAHAWLFYAPDAWLRPVADTLTGAKGEQCVNAQTHEGDVLVALNGNTAQVLSLSPDSPVCQSPALPVRAELLFHNTAESSIHASAPVGFEADALNALERFNGEVFKAHAVQEPRGTWTVMSVRRDSSDVNQVIEWLQQNLQNNPLLHHLVFGDIHRVSVQNAVGWTWSAQYKERGLFDTEREVVFGVFEGPHEILVLRQQGPTAWMHAHPMSIEQGLASLQGFQLEASREEAFQLVHLEPIE